MDLYSVPYVANMYCCVLSQVEPADKVVKRLIDQIVSQEPGYQYFKSEPGRLSFHCFCRCVMFPCAPCPRYGCDTSRQ